MALRRGRTLGGGPPVVPGGLVVVFGRVPGGIDMHQHLAQAGRSRAAGHGALLANFVAVHRGKRGIDIGM